MGTLNYDPETNTDPRAHDLAVLRVKVERQQSMIEDLRKELFDQRREWRFKAACAAMTGLLTNAHWGTVDPTKIAADANRFAAALLAELERTERTEEDT